MGHSRSKAVDYVRCYSPNPRATITLCWCKYTCVFDHHTRVFTSNSTCIPIQPHVCHIENPYNTYRQIYGGLVEVSSVHIDWLLPFCESVKLWNYKIKLFFRLVRAINKVKSFVVWCFLSTSELRSKLLSLGNSQINLVFRSLIRNSDLRLSYFRSVKSN